MVEGILEFYSHFYTVNPVGPRMRVALREWLTGLIEKKLTKKRGKFYMEPHCVYAAKSTRHGRYHLHRNEWELFHDHLKKHGIQDNVLEFRYHEPVAGAAVTLDMGEWVPWDNQVPVIDFAFRGDRQTCITTQMGGGKTIMALFIATRFGQRFAVQTKGGYEGRWLTDAFYKTLNLKPEEVRSCCGAARLYQLIREKKKKGIDDVKAIFISNGAIRTYINNYESGSDAGTGAEDVPPWELYSFLGVGLRVTDETHQEFHANYIADLYTHVPMTVYLTGTLYPRDEFIKRVYETMLPHRIRKEAAELRVYADMVEVFYNVEDPRLFESFNKQSVYSHNEFEKIIMRHPKMLERYKAAVYNYALDQWVLSKEEGTKLLIFTGLVDMGQHLLEYFRRKLPDLIVNSFNAGDEYDVLEKSDIIFSTVIKAGTAVDIPDLTQVHNTVSSDSPNQNVQAMGRLRELKHRPEVQVEYHAYICEDVPKQVLYSQRRAKLFKPRVKRIRQNRLGRLI